MRQEWYHKALGYGTEHARSLLDVALDVHMTNTGSMERHPNLQCNDLLVLAYALETWKEGRKQDAAWDETVKNLIQVAFNEYTCVPRGKELSQEKKILPDPYVFGIAHHLAKGD